MAAKASPKVSSTIGVKNLVFAELIEDSAEGLMYDELLKVDGIIDVQVAPNDTDPEVQYADDIEFDIVNPDPDIGVSLEQADLPLIIQSKILGHKIDDNGALVKTASDKPPYYAMGFKSEKANGSYRYVWLYKGRAKPVTETYHTKEGTTINRQTGKVEFTFIKRTHDGQYQATADEGENGFTAAKGETFLESVYEPTFTAQGG